MSEKGWVTLDRQLQDHWLWQIKPFSKAQAWIDLIMLVNHKDSVVPIGNEVLHIKRGTKPIGLRQMGERWGWSARKVSGFLNLLENDKMIVQKRNTKGTLVTIVNYENFQEQRNTNKTQIKHKSNTNKTQKQPNNNVNNDNNVNKKDIEPSASENQEQGIDYGNIERKWD